MLAKSVSRPKPEGAIGCNVLMTTEFHSLILSYQDFAAKRGKPRPSIAEVLVRGAYQMMQRDMGKSFREIK